jgi:hypothetical protein
MGHTIFNLYSPYRIISAAAAVCSGLPSRVMRRMPSDVTACGAGAQRMQHLSSTFCMSANECRSQLFRLGSSNKGRGAGNKKNPHASESKA